MRGCLGIHIGNKVIKYAKLIQDEKTGRISLDSYGTKYSADSDDSVIEGIINETGSKDDTLCINVKNYHRIQTEVLKQLNKSDVKSVISLEVGDYAASNDLNEKMLDYRMIDMISSNSNDCYTYDVAVTDKSDITRYKNNPMYNNLTGLYTEEYILNNLVQNSSNYIVLNIDEKTELISVVGGKINKIIDIDINMGNVLSRLAEEEGSYSKAIDICRSINVLSDDENLSHEIERIIEPIIQDLLNRIKAKLDESRVRYERMYLTGLINLFINIDVLFEQFFGITTEKLKPYFLKSEDLTLNLAEIIESNEAISLALEGIERKASKVNFLQDADKKSFLDFFNKKDSSKNDNEISNKKKKIAPINPDKDKIESGLLIANIVAIGTLTGYVGFSAIYSNQMASMDNKLKREINNLKTLTSDVQSDTKYIKDQTDKYTEFNEFVSDTITKIKEGKIGKYTTYNVANFMQKIARYIPSNVELKRISSDDNKSVQIVASSTLYSELGYFVSQLKLKGILENVKTTRVETGSIITVTIGGDLP